MKIDIANRCRPFSHEYGESFLLPRTRVVVKVFPTRLEFGDKWIDFGWSGPIEQFTAQLDLEREELCVFGQAPLGYFSYVLKREGDSVMLIIEKAPPMEKKQRIELMKLESSQQGLIPRLSLGSHKAQEFSKMKKRKDPCELFPLWLRLAGVCPSGTDQRGQSGQYGLLDECYRLVAEEKKLEIVKRLLDFFQSAFTGVFVPRLIDTEYQGIVERVEEPGVSAMPLLMESAVLIRSLFYQEKEKGEVAILPLLPPDFHCGRFIDITLSSGVVLSFEWTKKKLRRLILAAPAGLDQEVNLVLQLPRAIVSCRRASKRQGVHNVCVEEERVHCVLSAGEKMELDRFHNQ